MKRNEILCYFNREKMRRFLIRFKFLNLLLVFVFCQLSVNVSAQKRVSLNLSNTSLDKVFQQIQQQIDYRFIFNNDDVSKFTVSGTFETTDIHEVLNKVLEGKPFNYAIDDEVIIISYKPGYSGVQENVILIKGIVKDKQGYPLPGASVVIDGTQQGITTNESGEFTIPLHTRDVALKISFIGMKPVIVRVGNKDMLEIVMEDDIQEMNEVVVTGIFQKARESYTGAVTTITEKELKTFGNRNILTTIRNIDPSFNILQDNINGSDPNRLPDIQIRGTSSVPTVDNLRDDVRANLNQPLFIQDGFEITLQQMMDINQDEVESINILKDASATALYGSRGANGVIVIKTKDPEPGQLKITYRGNLNVEIPDLTDYHVLNAREKLDLEVQSGIYSSRQAYSQQILDEIYNWKKGEIERGVDTYWLSQPLRTGYGQRHDLRMEGGDNVFRYSASLSYNDVVGVMKGSGRQTFNGGIKLSYYYKNVIFTNYLTIGLNKAENSPYGAFSEYVKMNPYWSPKDENGNTKFYLENFDNMGLYQLVETNPLYNAHLNTFNTSNYTNITNNFSIEWKIRNDLSLRGRFGITKNQSNTDIYKPKNHTDFSGYRGDDIMRKGSYTYGTGKDVIFDGDATLNYSKNFNEKHQVFAGVNVNIAQNDGETYVFEVEGFPNDRLDTPSAALQYTKERTPTGSEYLSRRIGFVGNFNYTFDNRYFVDATYRVDGSSQFGANKRFAPFWSTGIGWNLHNEHFFNVDFIDQLRVKASYGISGSQNFNTYQALRTYKYYMRDYYQQWYGAYLMALGNKDLKWQQTNSLNIGFEARFWNSRIYTEFNYYKKVTDNLLSSRDLPLSNGFSSYTENIGKVQNTGFEAKASVQVIRDTEREILWSLTGSIMLNKNKLVKISDALKKASDELSLEGGKDPNYLYKEGKSMNTIYVVPSLGIDPSNGKELYLNRFGQKTYTWDARDIVDCGIYEKYRGNISTNFRYKNLSANVVFGYGFGGQLYNSTLINRVENANVMYNVDKRVYEDRWMKPGDKTFFKGINETGDTQMSSRFVQNENTFECQNINLTYDLRHQWLSKNLGLNLLSFQCDMGDIFRVSSIKQERGINYPFSRKVSFTLSATF